MNLLTTQEAAEKLNVSTARIRALILSGRLKAEKFGHVHMIKEDDLALVSERKPGRPPLTEEEKAERTASRGSPATVAAKPAKQTKPKATKPATKKEASKKAGSKKAESKKPATKKAE